MHVRLLHIMHVRLCIGHTQGCTQIMQHTYTQKAVIGRIEAKKSYSLVEGNQTIVVQLNIPCYWGPLRHF